MNFHMGSEKESIWGCLAQTVGFLVHYQPNG